MPNILDLLQATGGMGQPQQDAIGPDVVVPAQKPRVLREDPRDPDAANNAQANASQELIKRHGLFGLKGTIRDVVGTLGDAFLVGQGGKAIYTPQRQQEKIADAMYGYNDDPKAAAERVGMIDPEMGYGMSKDVANQDIQRSRYADEKANQRAALAIKGYGIAGSFANVLDSPEKYAKGKAQLQKMIDTYGLDIELPDQYDPDALHDVFRRAITPDQTVDNQRADAGAASQDTYRKGQLGVAQQRVQATREAAAARNATQRAHNTEMENQGRERLRQGQEKIDKPPTTKKGSILDKLGIGTGNIPPPPGGGQFRKIK